MFFKSIRFKIILWYTLLLTVTLFSFSSVLYGSFKKILIDHLDDLLESKAEGIADSVTTYWRTSQASDMNSFVAIARNWVEEKRKDPELMSIFEQILDAKGERLVSSKSMPRITPLPKEDFDDVLEGEDTFDTVGGESAAGKKMKFRVYTKPVIEDNKVVYVVQVTGPISLLSLALNNLRLILFVLLPLTVLLAGIPGVLLVRMTLRPVDKMINTLRQITAENLKLKIRMPDTKDEIKRLADTFNDMIERLNRSFSSQARFIQETAHELEAPIKILKDELELAIKGNLSQKDYEPVLLKAREGLNGFSKTIENLLLLSRSADNKLTLEIKKTDVSGLAEGVLNDIKILADDKGIAASFSSPGAIMLDGDENQLRRVFMNLFDNAVKYTRRNGRIDVAASKDDKYARVAVTDTGSGIPEDELPYIFDRFYQAAKSRGSKNGFGLGLSSAKSIAELHKGAIMVESRVGKGSTFTVSLPLSYPI